MSDEELFEGTRLGFDSWADTSCAGRHAYIESFIEGKSVNAVGFSSSLGSLKNLPIVNAVYAYDYNDGHTILLENFNAIYIGDDMEDSLVNPVQCEDNNVHVDLRPQCFYPHLGSNCQKITFEGGETIPLEFDGVLPCIRVRRPTENELHTCKRLQLKSENDWDPVSAINYISSISSNINLVPIETVTLEEQLLMQESHQILSSSQLLYNVSDDYKSIYAINTNRSNILTPEKLSKLWMIGLPTAMRTIKATTQKCIRSTGMLARRYKTDRSQL